MLSVTCPKCSARYSMSEDLYRRKGGGEAVVVTCRKCKSEIRFEAPDEKTKPSNETPMSSQESAKAPGEEGGDDHGPFVALSSGFFGPGPSAGAAAESGEGANAPLTSSDMTSASPAEPAEEKPEAPSEPELEQAPLPPAVVAKPVEERQPPSEKAIDSAEVFSDDMVMSVRGDELETETVPLVINKSSNGASSEPPPAFEPNTNPKLKKPLPPPRKKEVAKVEEDDEPPPSSSGTPTLTALMSKGSFKPGPSKNRVDEDFFAGLGAQSMSLAPPTIDLNSLGAPPETESEPPESERAPDSIPVSARAPHKKKKKRKHSSQAPDAPRAVAPKATAAATTSTAPKAKRAEPTKAQPEPEQKSSSMVWVIGGLVLLGGAFFLWQQSQGKPVEPETAQTAAPTAEAAPTAPATATAAAPTAEATATAPLPSAAAPTPTPTTGKPGEALNKPAEAKPTEGTPTEAKPTEAKPAEEKPAEAKPAEEKPAEPAATGAGPFQPDAAKAALAASAAQASGCRKGDDPAGSAVVIITFATSGRVTSANVNGPPFAGTATGGCIAAAMRKTKVPPFDGDRITVSKTVQIQ
jgi:hypothetical protein